MEPKPAGVDCEHLETTQVTNHRVIPSRKGPTFYLAIAGIVIGYVAAQECSLLTSPLTVAINDDIGPVTYIYWARAAFGLAQLSTWAIAGSLSDRHGRRNMLILGHTIALIGAIVCCTAHKPYVLIVGMTILGAGTACQLQAVPIIAEIFRKKYRAIVLGLLVNSPYPFLTCPTLIAHDLTRATTWRWVFYINIILTFVAFLLTYIFYHPPPRPDEMTWNPKRVFRIIRQIDHIGILLIYLFLLLLTLALVWAGFGRYGWATAAVLVPLCISVPVFLGIMAWEYYGAQWMGAKHHLFPPIMFTNHRGFTLVQLIGAFSSMAVAAIDNSFPVQITGIYTTDSTTTGLYAFPSGFGIAAGALLCGFLLRRIGHTNVQLVVVCLLLGLFVALMATLTPKSVTPGLVYSGFVEFFSGWILILLYVMIQFSYGDDLIGTTTGVLHVTTNMGPAFAISFYFTIVRSMVAQDLPKYVAKAVLPLGLPITSLRPLLEAIASKQEAELLKVPGITLPIILAAIHAAQKAQSHSYRIVYFVAMTCCILAAIMAAFTRDVTPQMNDDVTVDLARDGGSLRSLVVSEKNEESTHDHV